VGLTVANVHFDDHSNDIAMHGHAYVWRRAIHEAVGATRTFPTSPYPSTHNPGTNRMSENPSDGVKGGWVKPTTSRTRSLRKVPGSPPGDGEPDVKNRGVDDPSGGSHRPGDALR